MNCLLEDQLEVGAVEGWRVTNPEEYEFVCHEELLTTLGASPLA
jgi:hypothetical protein